jgi:tyrosinase
MANFTRKNAWNLQGTFNNPDLLWYAKGVGVMQSRALNDKNSWWFFAAIHGFSNQLWSNVQNPPKVPTTPKPSVSIQNEFWNQCQHQSWYFAPWHRGYLKAFEEQIRSAIISLGGPNDWALPYWNYFGPDNQHKLPPAFAERNLPDGTANPLFVISRYGLMGDGNIYIAKESDTSVDPEMRVSEKCQDNTKYTGSDSKTSLPGYGGPITGFSWRNAVSGNLENNPHNFVHVHIGGFNSLALMSDPRLAALDPIFYLHHCNIDRMWASWNEAGNSNPQEQNWLDGPTAFGERKFIMPLPDGSSWTYSPKELSSLSQLNYDYEEISKIPEVVSMIDLRLEKFKIKNFDISNEKDMDLGQNSELVGVNKTQLKLKGEKAVQTTIKFASTWNSVKKSFIEMSDNKLPNQVYLQIEEVTGKTDANILSVIINGRQAGSFSLFGLSNASKSDGHHGGVGLTFLIDITNIIDDLHLENVLDSETPLDIAIVPKAPIPDGQKINIGRISLYRVI